LTCVLVWRGNQWTSEWGEQMIQRAAAQIAKERSAEGFDVNTISDERLRAIVLRIWLEQAVPAGVA
jgi:hypothetical protein